ncbi:hypothetical protein D9615_008794 [Tricholomella constricta]|uniref:Uncharacterized protein n=1 Tax=Tricholomella constricta TaxID=117010 RepID=A0A8H5M2H3_9AGAR|nr:hypothetical protein D9615_008794 [Tricholomella constricta]
MSLPDLDCLDFSLHSRSPSRSPSPDPDPNTSSTLFPTLRKYLKSPSREIELVRKDQADLLTQVALHEEDELVQEDTLRDLAELDGRSRPLQNRIKTTKFLARIHPNTRLGLHSKIDQCRTKLKNVEQNYKTKSSEASDIREKVEADLLAQGQLQNLTLTASGSTPPRQGAQPNVANIPYASNAGVSRDICTNIHSALNAQREAESRTLSSPSTEITTTTEEERNENRPPSYRPLPSTSERGHGLSTASPQDLSPTHILLPHEVQPTRSAGPSSGYNRPLPNPPAVPSTGTPALPGVDALAVTPGQTRTHSKTVSQSPSATRTTRPAGGRAPTQNHSSHFVESARAQSQQATRPTHSNHVSAGTVPSQSTDHCSSPGHGRESDDRAFHLNPSALSVKASDGHDQASATTSSHVSQRHSSVPAASQPKPSNQRNTPNSSATPIASHRQRSASQALKPSWTQSSMGSQDRRVHDEAVGQSPRDLESGQLSQVPTVPLRQPPLEGLTPAVQVDRRSPSNSSAMPIASPRQRSASQAPQPSSTQSYMRSRDRRVHDEALGQSLRNLESGQLSQGPTIPPRHPPLGSLAPTLRTDNEPETTRPTMRVKLPIAGSEHAALPPTRGIPAACISGPAPQNERPRRITQTTSKPRTVHRATLVDGYPETLTCDTLQRKWSLPPQEAFLDERWVLNAPPYLRLEEHQMLIPRILLHRMSVQAGPLTPFLVPVKVTAAERLTLRRRLAELRIVHHALDLTPVDYCPEPLNRDALQRRWSLPPKVAFIDERLRALNTLPCLGLEQYQMLVRRMQLHRMSLHAGMLIFSITEYETKIVTQAPSHNLCYWSK